jgi:signal transduction histidine kinase
MGLAMPARIQEIERGLAGVLPAGDARRAAEVIVRGGWCAQAGVLTPILRRHGAASTLPLLDAVGRARSSLRSLELSVRRLDGLGRSLRETADALRGGAPAGGSFDLYVCLEAAAEEAAHAVTPGSSFHVACDPGILAAGPMEPIERVITNLCLNALAAVGPSGGHVTLTGCVRDGEALLAVEDNGPGIADSIRDRLFTPFVTTKPRESGGGLGLFVCRRIVESRGGEISFTTGPSGTRFEVRLPLAAPGEVRRKGGRA